MAHHDVVAIGASAGGFRALRALAGELPGDFAAAILVTLHLAPDATMSVFPDMIARAGKLRAAFAGDGDAIVPGRIYIAPPDVHLLADGARLRLRRGPRENRSRPAIDPMFRSVAASFGARAIGVVLTGNLSDGSSGLHAIKRCGGTAVVQDPHDAEYPDMPSNALAATPVDHVAPLDGMAALLRRLVAQPTGETPNVPEDIKREVAIAAQGDTDIGLVDALGERSAITCPECHGLLWEIKDGGPVRYRCHIGHAFALDSLAAGQKEALDRALSSALRTLEERAALVRRLQREAQRRQRPRAAAQWERRARDYEQQASVICQAMLAIPGDDGQPEEDGVEPEGGEER